MNQNQKVNYDKKLDEIINSLDNVPKLLLHSCCAPCSSAVIERLSPFFDITIIYYNPNIEPKEEYEKRKNEQLRLLKELNIDYFDIDYLNQEYHEKVKGYENEPENGKRCPLCYELRMAKTAQIAKDNNFDFFGTTLTVSPHKPSAIINEIGLKLEKEYQVRYLVSDFKKEDGYKRSIELSKEYNLYRQDYCGCLYSRRNNNEE